MGTSDAPTYMCQLTPLNNQKRNGPTNDHVNPNASVTISAASKTMEAVRDAAGLCPGSEKSMFAPFQTRITRIPYPATR